MALYEEINITQGTDIAIELYLANIDGTTKNLAGYSVAAQMRPNVNSSDSDAVTFTSIVPDPVSSGMVVLMLTNLQTSNLSRPRYLYDVEISFQDSAGNVFVERVLEGVVNVEPKITRVLT